MPKGLIKNVSKNTGKSQSIVEKDWKKAEKIAATKFPLKTNRHYAYTMGIFKKMTGYDNDKSISETYIDFILKI